MKPGLARLVVTALALFVLSASAAVLAPSVFAQTGPDPIPIMNTENSFDPTVYGTVLVYLRTEDGQPLTRQLTPIINIVPESGGTALRIVPQLMGDDWMLKGVGIGNDYKVRVVASGYTPTEQLVRLPNSPGASASVIVFMHPIDQELMFQRPVGQFILPPTAEKETQRAFQDLQSGHLASAQKHTQKAIQFAPENPYPQYVMGLTYCLSNDWQKAKPYLEKSVSIDPKQARSLEALGTVRYRLGDNAGAIEALTKAIQLDGRSWKAEWLLAASYIGEKMYEDAANHAQQAINIGKQKAGQVQLVLGEALAGKGEREAAAKAFDAFAAQYPNDKYAAQALEWSKLMREPAKVMVVSGNPGSALGSGPAPIPVPAVEVPPLADWAPPDIDAVKPFVISSATCPLEQVLKSAGANAEDLVNTLQQFSAREDFQGVEIKKDGALERPDERAFSYLVFIEQVSPQAFDVKEYRNQGAAEAQLPGRVADTGVAAMALAFHPMIQPDLDWTCEGLGRWNDQPAWVIHFAQNPKKPNVLAMFSGPSSSFGLPLKGRAWVSERGSQVLHLETDLVKEIQPIDLKREHFSINYKQVSFKMQKVDLWLPESVDSYIQYQGHFLHYYHHFSDFKLFWVGATQKINDPKEAKAQGKPEEKPEEQ